MRKSPIRLLLVILGILFFVAVTHFLVFPQESNCILIRFADFEKEDNIYFRKETAPAQIITLKNIRSDAEQRVKAFWDKQRLPVYNIIYCNNEKDFNRYGHEGAPAATQLKMGAYVVLKEESLDTDILAHEISHTVLYNTLGWYRTKIKIPTWFDEGLAMQVDNRDYYSIDSLMAKKDAGVSLPDVTLMKNSSSFFSGSVEEIMFNFSTAKYIVHEWLQTHSLQRFVEAMKSGSSFEKAYRGSAE